jgi:hypothetical protein
LAVVAGDDHMGDLGEMREPVGKRVASKRDEQPRYSGQENEQRDQCTEAAQYGATSPPRCDGLRTHGTFPSR